MVKLKQHTDNNIPSTDIFNLLTIASHSPSSHNTQPWLIKIVNDKIIVGYDPNRQLHVGDSEKRELFISLGCFIETLIIAATDKGYNVKYSFVSNKSDHVAELTLTSKNKNSSENKWIRLITSRRSDRRAYDTKQIPEQDINFLQGLIFGDASISITDTKNKIQFLSEMTHKATNEIMSAQDFRDELATWVRNNWTKKPDGMPGYTQGMPGPISLLAKFVIKKSKKVAIDQAKKDSKRIMNSAAIGIIKVSKQIPSQWIEAGRLYQKVCLHALNKNIKTSAISAAIIAPDTKQKIVKKLGLKGHPVALLRFGYTKNTAKATPRRKPIDFVTNLT